MIHAIKAEWMKLTRRGMILGGAGVMVGFMTLATLLTLQSALPEPPTGVAGPVMRPTLAQIEASDGLLSIFGILVHIVGIVSAVIFAQSIGSEYSNGTLKVMLTREPRRLVLLSAKILAISGFIAAAIFVAFIVLFGASNHMADAKEYDISAWMSSEGWSASLGGLARLWVAALVQGLIGLTLGVLFRSPAPAVGVGIGYIFALEPLIIGSWSEAAKWLPGPVLTAFTKGGTADVPILMASALVALYSLALIAVAGVIIQRRDVVG